MGKGPSGGAPDSEQKKVTCWSHDSSNLFHRFKIGTETAVTAEDLFVDNRRKWEAVEAICERFPKLESRESQLGR